MNNKFEGLSRRLRKCMEHAHKEILPKYLLENQIPKNPTKILKAKEKVQLGRLPRPEKSEKTKVKSN